MPETLPFERQEGESFRAFAAFVIYRELPPTERSLKRAYSEHNGKPSKVPGFWSQWSVKHEWTERAAAYDAHLDKARQAEREIAERSLAQRRIDFEVENQKRLEERVRKIEAMLDRADQSPIIRTESIDRKPGADGRIIEVTKTEYAIDMGKYAALLKACNLSAREAIIGVREVEASPAGSDEGEAETENVFVWVRPDILDAAPEAPAAEAKPSEEK